MRERIEREKAREKKKKNESTGGEGQKRSKETGSALWKECGWNVSLTDCEETKPRTRKQTPQKLIAQSHPRGAPTQASPVSRGARRTRKEGGEEPVCETPQLPSVLLFSMNDSPRGERAVQASLSRVSSVLLPSTERRGTNSLQFSVRKRISIQVSRNMGGYEFVLLAKLRPAPTQQQPGRVHI